MLGEKSELRAGKRRMLACVCQLCQWSKLPCLSINDLAFALMYSYSAQGFGLGRSTVKVLARFARVININGRHC